MSFLTELKLKKNSLKHTETLVTFPDGKQIIENGEETTNLENKKYGFVVDTKPDTIPACILENQLFLGSQDSVDSENLQKFKISHILSVGIETPEFSSCQEIQTIFIKCLDLPETDLKDVLEKSFNFIEESLESAGCVLVHCNQGVSRSSSIVIGYLMKKFKYDFTEAYGIVKSKRECIQPNAGFMKQLKNFY